MFELLVPDAVLKKLPGMDAGMLKLLKQAQVQADPPDKQRREGD
jgi:hypothetical protein